MEAIILAGGYGKRLKHFTEKIPKPLLLVNGIPFLTYIFELLLKYNVKRVVLSVFYKKDSIYGFYGNKYKTIKIDYTNEEDAYGTGGAIKCALDYICDDTVIVVNGDTYFDINLNLMYKKHKLEFNNITFATKFMKDCFRYGMIKINKKGKILDFIEKGVKSSGYINGGYFMINKNLFKSTESKIFMFNDFIINNINNLKIGSISFNDYFIDIGTPKDYARAQNYFKNA